jgi:hypothetical protein
MSGYSTDWQKHLYDDIETERYLDGSMPREAGDASGRPNKDTDVAEGAVEATESAAPLDEESPVDILHEVCGGEVDLQEALVEAHAVMMHMTEGAFQCPAVDDWERRYGELIAPATVDTDESPVGFVQVGEPQPQGQSITASASTEAEVAGDLKATFDGPTNSFEIAAEDKPELHLPLRKGRDKKSGLMLEVVDTNGNFICEAESEVTANAIVEAVNGWHGLEGADDLAKALAKESVKLRQRVAELEAENEALSRVAKSYKVTCAELVKSEGENAQMRALLCEWSSQAQAAFVDEGEHLGLLYNTEQFLKEGEIVAAIASLRERVADLRDAEVSGLNIDNSLIERIEELEDQEELRNATGNNVLKNNNRLDLLTDAVLKWNDHCEGGGTVTLAEVDMSMKKLRESKDDT